MESSPLSSPPSKKQLFKDIVNYTVLALLIVIPIRFFIAQPFVVSGESMVPTFNDGNYLIVDEISYRFETPKRGDIVVFKFPSDEKRYLIKRVIGLPGETVDIKDGRIFIKNKEHPNSFELTEPYLDPKRNLLYGNQTTTLTNNQYFVMGDNRVASSDSRIWGPLPKDLIVGRPFLRLFPITAVSAFPGAYNNYLQ